MRGGNQFFGIGSLAGFKAREKSVRSVLQNAAGRRYRSMGETSLSVKIRLICRWNRKSKDSRRIPPISYASFTLARPGKLVPESSETRIFALRSLQRHSFLSASKAWSNPQDGAEADLSLVNTLKGFGSFGQRISFRDDFYLALSDVVECFVKVFR